MHYQVDFDWLRETILGGKVEAICYKNELGLQLQTITSREAKMGKLYLSPEYRYLRALRLMVP